MQDQADDADALAILRADERWIEAFNAGDVETLAALYDPAAIVMPPERAELRGRAEIRAWLADFFADNAARQSLVNDEVVVAGDWAFLRGHFRIEITARDGREESWRGKHLVIWKRQPDGSWKAARDIWNMGPGAPAVDSTAPGRV